MSILVLVFLLAGCVVMLILERAGVRTTLHLHFKGDIKRESRWFAQYGQSVCTPIAALLVWQLDPHRERGLIVFACVAATSLSCVILKRAIGRVRPGREHAGKFLGPTWKHANYRESFPSSHSACAFALSASLVHFYPQAAITFWGMALICAALRYFLDAHWPSDVWGGAALGYGITFAVMSLFPPTFQL